MCEHMFALSMGGGHLYVWDGQAVRPGETFVSVAATKSAAAVHRTWTFVCQLQTAAVRPGETGVRELQTAAVHQRWTFVRRS